MLGTLSDNSIHMYIYYVQNELCDVNFPVQVHTKGRVHLPQLAYTLFIHGGVREA